jgi:AraC-like DNA-binding protein
MPGSVTSTFSEPEDFEDALRKEGCRGLVVTGRGQFRARLTQITLHRLRLSAAEEQLSRIAFITIPNDVIVTAFPIDDGTAPVGGRVQTRSLEIMVLSPGEQVHLRTDGPRRWGAIWFPVEELAQYGSAMNGVPFVTPAATRHWCPPREAIRRLRSLHAAAIRMAATRPQALVDSDAARGLEQQLIDATVDCLSAGSAGEGARYGGRNRDIMARFEQLLQRRHCRLPLMAETCAALNVSEQVLRSLCAEHLGMSPTAYDRLRRMSLARRALRRGAPEAASVSEVARHYGFRNLGRFAITYRAAYGEYPFTTLQRRSGSVTRKSRGARAASARLNVSDLSLSQINEQNKRSARCAGI